MSTIYILWLRQIKRYLRSKSRLVGSLAQPLLFLVALGFGFGPVYQQAGEGSYVQFLVPGIISMTILFTAMFSGIEIIWDRQFGFLKETMVAPVSRLNIMIGRTLGGATVAIMQGLIVLILASLFGFHPVSWSMLPLAILAMLLIALFFTGLGTAIASLLQDMQGFQLIMNFLIMPIFFLSGALFPLKSLPLVLNTIIKFNPLAYGVDALRDSLINQSYFGLSLDFTVMAISAMIILGIGTYLFNKIQI
ncbi:MAG: ABC transporter permease [Candidatus Parcubacteria bacterium]|nr:ABC transporter permease [Candidatus Parcubacteria bacterium]